MVIYWGKFEVLNVKFMNHYQICLIIFVSIITVIVWLMSFVDSGIINHSNLENDVVFKGLVLLVWSIFMIISFAIYFYLSAM